MTTPSFLADVTAWLSCQLGDVLFTEGIPPAPPGWFAKEVINCAQLERTWIIFRERCEGVPIDDIARRHGMHVSEVRVVTVDVLQALLRGHVHELRRATPQPQVIVRPEPPSSVLERDCMVVNTQLVHRPGTRRLHVAHLLRVGIDAHTSLAHVPDDRLLAARHVGPTLLREIRRLFPFEPDT
jgi:hypothetical protein